MAAMLSLVLVLVLPTAVLAQNGDGGAASGNLPATDNSGTIAGASGSSSGWTLSTGAIIAIALVVATVIILGISTSILFFIAKRRQWTVRETLRHSRRRVTTGLKTAISPLTPGRATFATSGGPTKIRLPDDDESSPKPLNLRRGQKNHGIGLVDVDLENLAGKDLEKGEGTKVVMSERPKKQKPTLNLTKPARRVVEPPKTPMFNKIFGRE